MKQTDSKLTETAKTKHKPELSAALRANLKRRKAATTPAKPATKGGTA